LGKNTGEGGREHRRGREIIQESVEENTGEGESELRRGWEITEEKLGENTGDVGR
jgi:hypothetical protein